MKQRNIFTTINPGSNIWIRNPNHFLKNFDLSGVAVSLDVPGSDYAANLKSAVLLSNRHVLIAQHIAGGTFDMDRAPKTVKFVNNNNEVFTYTIEYGYYVGGTGGNIPYAFASTDIAIGVLSTTVDPSLCYYKGLPSNLETYHKKVIDSCGSGDEMPVVWIDQDKNLSIGDAIFSKGDEGYIWKINASYDDLKYQYAQKAIDKDSGNAIFAIYDNQLIILGTWFTGAGAPRLPINKGGFIGSFNAIHKYYSSMNAWTTATIGSNYTIKTIDTNLKTFAGTKIPSIRLGTNKYTYQVKSYNRAPSLNGYTQESSVVSLYDDNYLLGQISAASDLSYSYSTSTAYAGLTTNGISGKASIAGNDSLSTDLIAYDALPIPAPTINSRGNTNSLRPTISGSWSQNQLTTFDEIIYLDFYDNNVKIPPNAEVFFSNLNTTANFNWTYTPSVDLSVGTHTIKAKAVTVNNTSTYIINNSSAFSNSITFDIIDTGGS